jgi:hypothetical protein
VSFFDEGDESGRPRPRRPAGGLAAPPDPQTARIRQGVAAGVILLVVILLVVGIRGCLNSQKKRSLRDYNREVASLVQESDDQVSKPFFEAMSGGAAAGGDPINLQTQVNQVRVVSEDLVRRARRLDVPDDMKPAQSNLLLVLELRRDGLRNIAEKLRSAQGTGTGAEQAVRQIAGQMMQFLASDVIYSQRVVPYIKEGLDRNDITGQTIATSQFLPTIDWLSDQQVAQRLGAQVTGGRRPSGPVAPGSHGHGLSSVTVGGNELSTDSANRIPASPNLTFTVNFENQAENDERNVTVRVSIGGAGAAITGQATVPNSQAGESSTVDVPLRQAPPVGRPVEITVEVVPVPGEEDSNNNRQAYPAVFTQG